VEYIETAFRAAEMPASTRRAEQKEDPK